MTIEQRLVEAIVSATNKSWRYRKDLLEIRPEYLLTVAAADSLSNGFDGICGIDVQITLEARTRDVCFEIMKSAVGIKAIIKGNRLKLHRKGRIDVFLSHEKCCWAVELKGFDPQANQIVKEIERFIQLLEANNWINGCEGCYLAFPAIKTKRKLIEKHVEATISGLPISATYTEEIHHTGEDPEDGIPVFKIFVVKISRTLPSSSFKVSPLRGPGRAA
ncbi:hypothetical protein [Pseudoxanthomonas japonensis]|nr:hypothetical protein [Pseudoxanthomonas japonensis]